MKSQHLNARPWRTAFGFLMSFGMIALSYWLSSLP
jgi:hypothetical protein